MRIFRKDTEKKEQEDENNFFSVLRKHIESNEGIKNALENKVGVIDFYDFLSWIVKEKCIDVSKIELLSKDHKNLIKSLIAQPPQNRRKILNTLYICFFYVFAECLKENTDRFRLELNALDIREETVMSESSEEIACLIYKKLSGENELPDNLIRKKNRIRINRDEAEKYINRKLKRINRDEAEKDSSTNIGVSGCGAGHNRDEAEKDSSTKSKKGNVCIWGLNSVGKNAILLQFYDKLLDENENVIYIDGDDYDGKQYEITTKNHMIIINCADKINFFDPNKLRSENRFLVSINANSEEDLKKIFAEWNTDFSFYKIEPYDDEEIKQHILEHVYRKCLIDGVHIYGSINAFREAINKEVDNFVIGLSYSYKYIFSFPDRLNVYIEENKIINNIRRTTKDGEEKFIITFKTFEKNAMYKFCEELDKKVVGIARNLNKEETEIKKAIGLIAETAHSGKVFEGMVDCVLPGLYINLQNGLLEGGCFKNKLLRLAAVGYSLAQADNPGQRLLNWQRENDIARGTTIRDSHLLYTTDDETLIAVAMMHYMSDEKKMMFIDVLMSKAYENDVKNRNFAIGASDILLTLALEDTLDDGIVKEIFESTLKKNLYPHQKPKVKLLLEKYRNFFGIVFNEIINNVQENNDRFDYGYILTYGFYLKTVNTCDTFFKEILAHHHMVWEGSEKNTLSMRVKDRKMTEFITRLKINTSFDKRYLNFDKNEDRLICVFSYYTLSNMDLEIYKVDLSILIKKAIELEVKLREKNENYKKAINGEKVDFLLWCGVFRFFSKLSEIETDKFETVPVSCQYFDELKTYFWKEFLCRNYRYATHIFRLMCHIEKHETEKKEIWGQLEQIKITRLENEFLKYDKIEPFFDLCKVVFQ